MRALIRSLGLGLVFVALVAAGGGDADPAALLRQGEDLIAKNCADCVGSSRQGLEEGIAAVRRALDLGVGDRAAAYRTLSSAYGQFAWAFAPPDSEAQQAARRDQRWAFEKLLELEPDNAQELYDYAFTLEDQEKKTEVLRKVVAIDPHHAEALFEVGAWEIDHGQRTTGLVKVQRAFALAKDEVALELGERLSQILTSLGETQQRREVMKRMQEIRSHLRQIEQGVTPPGDASGRGEGALRSPNGRDFSRTPS